MDAEWAYIAIWGFVATRAKHRLGKKPALAALATNLRPYMGHIQQRLGGMPASVAYSCFVGHEYLAQDAISHRFASRVRDEAF